MAELAVSGDADPYLILEDPADRDVTLLIQMLILWIGLGPRPAL